MEITVKKRSNKFEKKNYYSLDRYKVFEYRDDLYIKIDNDLAVNIKGTNVLNFHEDMLVIEISKVNITYET